MVFEEQGLHVQKKRFNYIWLRSCIVRQNERMRGQPTKVFTSECNRWIFSRLASYLGTKADYCKKQSYPCNMDIVGIVPKALILRLVSIMQSVSLDSAACILHVGKLDDEESLKLASIYDQHLT